MNPGSKKIIPPLRTIRKYCLECMNGNSKEVKLCPSTNCSLYPFRFGKGIIGKSRLKAIRKECLGCGEGTWKVVKDCEFKDCPLYKYRFGHNPNLKGKRGKGGNVKSLKKWRHNKRKNS